VTHPADTEEVARQSLAAAAATNSSRRGSIRSWPNETTFVMSQ
jgi:hypothetical protein